MLRWSLSQRRQHKRPDHKHDYSTYITACYDRHQRAAHRVVLERGPRDVRQDGVEAPHPFLI